jgi:hypothetical protein
MMMHDDASDDVWGLEKIIEKSLILNSIILLFCGSIVFCSIVYCSRVLKIRRRAGHRRSVAPILRQVHTRFILASILGL